MFQTLSNLRFMAFFLFSVGLAPGLFAQPASSLVPESHTATGSFVCVTHAPDDFSRLFLVNQFATIQIARLPAFTIDATPFITIPNVSAGGECGLLGMAFHPDYASNGYFYVFICRGSPVGAPSVMRFTRNPGNPDLADPASAANVINLGGGNGIHNGGWIGFGPDGYLYVSVGEGGNAASSRDITSNLRGKIVRIDVDGDDFPADDNKNYRVPPDNPFVGIEGDDEIFAYGFRNPWRCSIDFATAQLWIGDVGSSREEIDVLPLSSPNRDYGWNCQEGAVNNCGAGSNIVLPLAHYRNPPEPPLNISGNAVMGGEVYRGCALPQIRGRYFFGDLSGDVVSFVPSGSTVTSVVNHTATFAISQPYGFGHDAYGEVYVTSPGRITKIRSSLTIGPDCNNNGVSDACDLRAGQLTDANGDGIPDECGGLGDFDHDGSVGLSDLTVMLSAFGACAGDQAYQNAADFNSDGCSDIQDLASLLSRFGG